MKRKSYQTPCNNFTSTITITFGENGENHIGNQTIGLGSLVSQGFTGSDINKMEEVFTTQGFKSEKVCLNNALPENIEVEKAFVLVVRGFCKDANAVMKELKSLEWDSKCKIRGQVCNKRARHNLCFDFNSQAHDYKNGKGTIIAWADVPLLNKIRLSLPELLGDKAKNLVAEGNYYYDWKTCGIGFHKDRERKLVIGLRLGYELPLDFHWFDKGCPIGKRVELSFGHGDLYIMSEKAAGHDTCGPTLRHAAGAKKYRKIVLLNSKKN